MKKSQFKRCPRCDKKTPIYQDRCERCGLVFSRLAKASNTAAKKALKKKEYNKVIMDKVLPKDVNKWKLFFISLFFGFFGVHYAKVGRYKMFTYGICSAAGLYIAVCLPKDWFNHEYLFMLMWGLVINASMYAIIYVVSVCQILFNKFKVPIAIDEELVIESLDQELVNDILKEVKSPEKANNNANNQTNSKKQKNKNKNNVKQVVEEAVEDKTNIKKEKRKKIKVMCASCGAQVKVYNDEMICPKCDEPLKEE